MSNEQYLIASYFVVAGLSALIALVTALSLRGSFTSIMQATRRREFSVLLRRVFPLGLLLPSLAGFFSVTYSSCERSTYDKIIADRAYLVQINQRQISMSMRDVAIALLLWASIAVFVLMIVHREGKDLGKHGHEG